MSGINSKWEIPRLEDFIGATTVTYVESPPKAIGFHSFETSQSRSEIAKKDHAVVKILDRVVPEILAVNLYPSIWSGAASLWRSEHYRSTTKDAAKKFNAEIQNKIGGRDVREADLFNQSSTDGIIEPDEARLCWMPDDGSKTHKPFQRGTIAPPEGILTGIRNPLSHGANKEIEEQASHDHQAALSVLAR